MEADASHFERSQSEGHTTTCNRNTLLYYVET